MCVGRSFICVEVFRILYGRHLVACQVQLRDILLSTPEFVVDTFREKDGESAWKETCKIASRIHGRFKLRVFRSPSH